MNFVAATLLAAAAPTFDPVAFFTGRTHGSGTLRVALKAPQTVRVESIGSVGADGTLVLRQTIDVTGDKRRQRVWQLRRTGPTSFAGTLSDARGPVAVTAERGAIRIRYRTTDGLSVQQWLTPAPGGRAVDNQMTFSKLGVTVARLSERIEKR
ncbi:DUF3833 family protein [Sphingomonas mesophila]|uniref:DUF3833 family protein n=1 Tax=Sphingomonas mesophila TaxID=2303576 RepID=UPI000E597DE0|nr:DUF3833 family protein [Sphingomonas mesophila]